MKKKDLVSSVKSGRGIKTLSGLIVRVSKTETYNIFVDYKNPEQCDYMEKNYAELSGMQHPFKYYHINLNGENSARNIGLFMTGFKQEMHYLLKSFVEKECMTVWSNQEVISGRRYNKKEQKRVDAGIATMLEEIAKKESDDAEIER